MARQGALQNIAPHPLGDSTDSRASEVGTQSGAVLLLADSFENDP